MPLHGAVHRLPGRVTGLVPYRMGGRQAGRPPDDAGMMAANASDTGGRTYYSASADSPEAPLGRLRDLLPPQPTRAVGAAARLGMVPGGFWHLALPVDG